MSKKKETLENAVIKVATAMLTTPMWDIDASTICRWAKALSNSVDQFRKGTKMMGKATTEKSSVVGNMAKAREALKEAAHFIRASTYDIYVSDEVNKPYVLKRKDALAKISAALSAPPRNCDLPKVMEAPHTAWINDWNNWDEFGDPKKDIGEWLLAERKGENDA